jgi:ferrous iron transport protein B
VDPAEAGSLSKTLARDPGWSPLLAVGLIVFTMFYSPCFVSVICISKESGSWKWGVFAMVFNTVLAFVLAVLIFQIGSAFGILVK